MIGNSSSGIREASRTGTPSVILGSRQRGREFAENVIYVENIVSSEIIDSVSIQIKHGKYSPSDLYGDGTAGKKIAEVLLQADISVEKKFIEID
jgi:UDP-N-acetylglucosamine 2-epimerase